MTLLPRAAAESAPPLDEGGIPRPQRDWVMIVVILGVVLANLDGAIANIALPTIAREIGSSDAATVWVVNAYQLAAAVCLLPAAALGEIIGHKRVYASGLVIFGIASLFCAISPGLTALVAARVAQGIGGACLAALGPALMREIYPRRIIGQGFAMIALSVAISSALGPSIAAVILSVARWPWLFLVNLPFCAVSIPLFMAVAPPSRMQARRFDIAGAALNALALGLLVVGVNALGGANRMVAAGEIGAGLVCFLLLVWHQAQRTAPLLPLDLLRIPVFSLSVLTSICSYCTQILAYVSLPFLFQTVMHRSQVATGLLVTPWPVMVAVAAPIAGRLSGRYPASILGSIGLGFLTLGMVLLVSMPDVPADWDIAWRMGICGIGFGFFQTPNNTAIMTAGPVHRTGAAGGMMAVARTVGWALGSALVAVILELWGSRGPAVSLEAGALVAAFGTVVSSARLFTRR